MKIVLKLILLFYIAFINAQDFQLKNVPSTIVKKYSKYNSIPSQLSQPFYLDKIITNKNTDYTAKIQSTIDNYTTIIFPNFPIKINKNGLKIPSNRIIYFQPNSQIVFTGPADSRDSDIIKIYNAQNVKIYNANIKGSKYSKVKQWGEWSAGIAILGSKNIEINGFNISDTYGDGIIVGNQAKDIVIQNGWIDQARRDGISITSGINVIVNNIVLSNTFGTLPMCGIQIEPDFATDNLSNIVLQNIIGYNNNNATININLGAYNKKTISERSSTISIKVDNITDYLSNFAIGLVINADNSPYTALGHIQLSKIKSISSRNFFWKDGGKSQVKIEYQNLFDKNNKSVLIN